MTCYKKISFCVLLMLGFILTNYNLVAQENEQDSIAKLISETKNDSVLIIHLKNLITKVKSKNELLAFDSYQKIIKICEAETVKKNSSNYYFKELVNAKNRLASIYVNIGNAAAASRTLLEALKVTEEKKLKEFEAEICNDIGILNYTFNHFDVALEYFNRSLKINKELKDRVGEAELYNNIGNIYIKQKDTLTGVTYFEKSLKIVKEENFKFGLAALLNNLGGIYLRNKNTRAKAKAYLDECYRIRKEINDERGISISLIILSDYYYLENNYKLALKYAQESNTIAKKTNNLLQLSNSTKKLYKIYKALNQPKEALINFELHKIYQDSIHSEESIKELGSQALKVEFLKKTYIDSVNFAKIEEIKNIEIKQQQSELTTKRNQQIALFIGLILVVVFAGFMYNRFKITKNQKVIIEEKNKEITDSITYAKRIQNAILPSDTTVKEYLPNNFVLYLPKDIIAGDFYWMESVSVIANEERVKQSANNEKIASPESLRSQNRNEVILFAAADCTGHGVPGAMVSVVCNNALNRTVREFGLTNPSEILNKTREIVVQEFEKSDDDVKDGMDIALCSLRFDVKGLKLNEPETVALLQYAGANNPLWIIREGKLIETKPNKQPIGKVDNPQLFTTHTIELQEGDTIYIFTDGFADQFGGSKGKKMMYKPFKQLLLSIQNKTMDEQKEILAQHFENWKGSLEQVDDVCVIGVRM
ncbi:MAG: tetratricopeptide repeat protein [Vicingaceae bacterium]|nr:tetratricopeptide repeat protein [Vicingaceae bacterium]